MQLFGWLREAGPSLHNRRQRHLTAEDRPRRRSQLPDVVQRRNSRNDCYGSRPCENVREPRKRRTGFSIAFLGCRRQHFFFRLTKLRRTFYEQIERASFRTTWVVSRHPGSVIARVRLRWLGKVRGMSAIGTDRLCQPVRKHSAIGRSAEILPRCRSFSV